MTTTRYAAQTMRTCRFFKIVILVFALQLMAGCKQGPIKANLRAPDASTRVPALVKAAGDDDIEATRELVRALMDDDAAVRLFAIQSLNTRFGQTLGYRYYDGEEARGAAVLKWRGWLAQNVDASFANPDPVNENKPNNPDTNDDGQPDP